MELLADVKRQFALAVSWKASLLNLHWFAAFQLHKDKATLGENAALVPKNLCKDCMWFPVGQRALR